MRSAVFNLVHSVLMILLLLCFTLEVQCDLKYFNVKKYGAVGDGRSDSTKAFQSCWHDACKWKGTAQFLVPHGTYLIRQLLFSGPCLGPMDFHNAGNLKAHNDNSGQDFWIKFQYIDKLTIFGGGSFDGHGQNSWLSSSKRHIISLTLQFVTNSRIDGVRFIDSKGTHIKIFGSNNIQVSHIAILSPGDSPNTDGINISHSNKIRILDSYISTGDDCVSILPGGQNINITGIHCGPGHGISIGSMGGGANEPDIKGVLVKNCNFTDTLNGVRIKTWATKNVGKVTSISFENIFIHNANNPIIIDQNYCPSKHCPKGDSRVQLNKVKFIDIRGVSKSRVAVNFQCSKYKPCQIETKNIDLKYDGNDGPAISSCSNVQGVAYGREKPPTCLPKHVF